MRKYVSLMLLALSLAVFSGCGGPDEALKEPAAPPPSSRLQPSPDATDTPAKAASGVFDGSGQRVRYRLPLTGESRTFTIATQLNPDISAHFTDTADNFVWREISRRTGVEIDFQCLTPDEMPGQYAAMLALEDTPDAMQNLIGLFPGSADTLIAKGLLLDLSGYLEEFAPNLSYYLSRDQKALRDIKTDGGAIPAIPRVMEEPCGEISGPVIRADWLELLGLDMPRTYQDYYEVLTAFKKNFGGGLLLTPSGDMPGNLWSGGYGTAVYLDEEQAVYPFYQVGGKLIWGPATDNYGSYLQMLAKWYDEGLIAEGFQDQTEETISPKLLSSGRIGVFWAGNHELDSYAQGQRLAAAPLPVLTRDTAVHFSGDYGKLVLTDSTFSIMASCEDPGLLLRLFDYRFSREGAFLCNYGLEGESFQYIDGLPYFTWDMIKTGGRPAALPRALHLSEPGAYPEYQHIFDNAMSAAALAAEETWSAGRDNDYALPDTLTLTEFEAGRLNTLIGGIAAHTRENTIRFITGQRPMDEFPDFQREQMAMGLDICLEIYQTAYDRWLER